MSSISSIYRSLTQSYRQLSSGKKVQTASDGAAELAISQKMKSQTSSYQVGSDNIKTGQNLLNVSDGAMSGITDSLQRMRELAVKASNGTMSASDMESIQMEIDQLKQDISATAGNTTYNTKHVLSGTELEYTIATGSGNTSISGSNATLEALGIADFDVTGDFDISVLDDAIDKVSSQRSTSGAEYNSLEYAYNYNQNAAYNITAAESELTDLDYGEAITEKKSQEVLMQYAIFAQKKKQENESNLMLNLLA